MGVLVLGFYNILVLIGDFVKVGDYEKVRSVFDMEFICLL